MVSIVNPGAQWTFETLRHGGGRFALGHTQRVSDRLEATPSRQASLLYYVRAIDTHQVSDGEYGKDCLGPLIVETYPLFKARRVIHEAGPACMTQTHYTRNATSIACNAHHFNCASDTLPSFQTSEADDAHMLIVTMHKFSSPGT